MKDENDYESMTVFEQVKTALGQSLAHGRGELNLKTTSLPLPPPPAGRAKVVALRKRLKMSQSVFAATLNISVKLVQSWEQGSRKPDRGELRLIELLSKEPAVVSGLILSGGSGDAPRNNRRHQKPARRKPANAA